MNKFLLCFLLFFSCGFVENKSIKTQVCVYGGTSAGIFAAIQLAKEGKSVVIIEPSMQVGGMSVEGLGGTDINNHKEFKNDAAVGGMALEFYRKAAAHYGFDFEKERSNTKVWRFEPHVAEEIFENWLKEYNIPVYKNERLILSKKGVSKKGTKIKAIHTESGRTFIADVFMDCTYEGDLLFYAGVSTIIGREAIETYGESKNGIRGINTHRQFLVDIDPYIVPGDSTSGTIHSIQNEVLLEKDFGKADERIQAFCFRACLTNEEKNRVPFQKPDNYHREWYEIYLRYLKADGELYSPKVSIPNNKTDLGAWHDLSHNLYGMNHGYPKGDYHKRQEIYQYHLDFTQGLFYFLANDPEVPITLRAKWSQWGTTKDEFQDNKGWPRMVYIRDGRRMVSDYVITQHHTDKHSEIIIVKNPIGVAYWPPDVHHVRRIVKDGAAYNEGFVFGGDDWKPFQMDYAAFVPRISECTNILTPTCPSSSHIAYGAIRLEWTFMILGESLGTAASLAVDQHCAVQDIPMDQLKKKLEQQNQVLTL